MLENALRDCPDELWGKGLWEDPSLPGLSAFWYIAYHALFWLDFNLSRDQEFAPPAPFTLSELDPAGVLPDRVYTRAELQRYLAHGRQKCQVTVESLTDEQARRPCRFGSHEIPFAELLLYDMRHVQEHAAQLNMFLGQQTGSASGWVAQAKDSGSTL